MMTAQRFKLRAAMPKRKDDGPGWLLTFDPIGEEGDPVVIHLTDAQYEAAVRLFPLERSAEDVQDLRRLEGKP